MVKTKVADAIVGADATTRRWKSTFAAARLAYDAADFKQSRRLLARAKALAEEIPEKLFALASCDIGEAAIMLAERRAAEAKKKLETSLDALAHHTEKSHLELNAVALRFYAQALADHGDWRNAEKQLQKSIDVLQGLGPEASVQLSYSLSDLSALYLVMGRTSEAESHIVKALKIASSVLGTESPHYVRTDMIYQLCMPMTADSQMEQAEAGIRKMQYAFGGNHAHIGRALDRYLKLLSDRGDQQRIEETEKQFGHIFHTAE